MRVVRSLCLCLCLTAGVATGQETAVPEGPAPTQEEPNAQEYYEPPPPVTEQAPLRHNVFNPQTTAFLDFVARSDNKDVVGEDGRVEDRMALREGEIDMRAAVDPYADAVMIVALEPGAEGSSVDLEEGYVILKKLPFWEQMPGGLKLKVGKFATEFGKMNVLHTHDQPFTSRPLPIEEFLGEEGSHGQGISGQFFLPVRDPNAVAEGVVQVLSGGAAAVGAEGENDLALLGHLRYFKTFHEVNDVELGLSGYWGKSNPTGSLSAKMYGLDLTYKWKPFAMGEWHSFVAGTELFSAKRTFDVDTNDDGVPDGTAGATPFGAYVFAQYQWDSRLYTGVRYDYTDSIVDDSVQRRLWAVYASYYTTEFNRLRVGFEHRTSDDPAEGGRNTIYFQLTSVFGSHPTEPYWVNR